MEWMVAARLHIYLRLIKVNNIRGVDLININEPYLKVSYVM